MSRRPSIHNGYPQYQEPIPMLAAGHQPQYRPPQTAYHPPYNPNRMSTRPSDYPPANNYFRAPSSARSSRPLGQQRQGYSNNDPNRPYQHNDGLGSNYDDHRSKTPSNSCWSKPLCLGLTRLSGGILFGSMTLLGAASIAGLVVSVVLYVNDINTDSQWKILGMVVSSIMLLTVLVTFCIFFCCYKQGRILGGDPNNDPRKNPQQVDGNYSQRPFDREQDPYYPSQYRSSVPYGNLQNFSPDSTQGDMIRVNDKLTNTDNTGAPLRPRDFQRGAWPSVNAYGGFAHRPVVPPRMASRAIQASPTQHETFNGSRNGYPNNNNANNNNNNNNSLPRQLVPPPGTRIEYIDDDKPRQLVEKRTRRFIEHPRYDIVEEIIERPRPKVVQEYVDIVEDVGRVVDQRGKGKSRYDHVSIRPIPMQGNSNPLPSEDFATDHFYQ